jgi:hypothetical protein
MAADPGSATDPGIDPGARSAGGDPDNAGTTRSSLGTAGSSGGGSTGGGGGRGGASPAFGGSRFGQQLRRRRRWVIAGVAVGAALLVLALCGGLAAVVAGIDRERDDHHDNRRLSASGETTCLELERRLNRVAPPGAAPDAARRATAIRDENAALRPYLTDATVSAPGPRGGDMQRMARWQQLLDARTTYAEALDRQASARTPAFFQPPRSPQGVAVADHLLSSSPAACAGAIRRLAAPDL